MTPVSSKTKDIFSVFKLGKEVLSHWYILLENFQTSPLDFYSAVEASDAPARDFDPVPDRVHLISLFMVRKASSASVNCM
jgi:hypothetical protein